MAKYTIRHACGHLVDHQLYGSGKDRDRRAMVRVDILDKRIASPDDIGPLLADHPEVRHEPGHFLRHDAICVEIAHRQESSAPTRDIKLVAVAHITDRHRASSRSVYLTAFKKVVRLVAERTYRPLVCRRLKPAQAA